MSIDLPRGQLVLGLEGTTLDDDARRLLDEVRPGGVILFARNVESLDGLRAMVAELHAHDGGLLVCIDQEGGPVDRLRPHAAGVPSAMALAAAADPELSRRAGALTGELLAWLGIDWDLAPVCDLALSRDDNAIGLRSFGAEPEAAAQHAGAFAAGLEAAGVLSCHKHFPGLGASTADSHHTLPVVATELDDHLVGELAVFQSLLPDATSVLISHAYYPQLSHDGALPATLSLEVTTGLLRAHLGFAGVTVTDDMVMGALAGHEIGEASVMAVEAGADALLVCHHPERMHRVADALDDAVRSGRLRPGRAAASLRRLDRMRRRQVRLRRGARPTRQPAAIGDDISALAEEVAGRSVRLEGRRRVAVPGGRIVVLRPQVKWLSDECARPPGSPFTLALTDAGVDVTELTYDGDDPEPAIAPLVSGPAPAAFLLATYDAHRKPAVAAVAQRLASRAPVLHLACGLADDLPEVATAVSVSVLGCGREAVTGGVRALVSRANLRG